MLKLVLGRRGALLLLLLAAGRPAALAQSAAVPVTFKVVVLAAEGADPALQREAAAALREAMEARGGVAHDAPDWVFLLGAMEVGEEGARRVVLSTVTLHSLPEEAVRWGRETELFYAGLPAEERAALPPQGEWLREQVSEDYMRQFGMVRDHALAVTGRAELAAGVAGVADRFFARHARP